MKRAALPRRFGMKCLGQHKSVAVENGGAGIA
jgi:hypothetical protein